MQAVLSGLDSLGHKRLYLRRRGSRRMTSVSIAEKRFLYQNFFLPIPVDLTASDGMPGGFKRWLQSKIE